MPEDINRVTLVGRLTRDCEVKPIANTTVCTFSIAVNRRVNRGGNWEDEASFFDIDLWGAQGTALQGYLKKGKQVGVAGALKQNRWETSDGQKHSRVVINANNVQLLGGRNDDSAGGGSANTRSENTYANQGTTPTDTDFSTNSDDLQDDIPF